MGYLSREGAGERVREWIRPRWRHLALAAATTMMGLAVHLHGRVLGPAPRDIVGDALWAAMVMWCVGAVAPHARLLVRAAIAYGVALVVELSQLGVWPALEAMRHTFVGHLVLGTDFDPRDLAYYALGIALAAMIELFAFTRKRQSPRG